MKGVFLRKLELISTMQPCKRDTQNVHVAFISLFLCSSPAKMFVSALMILLEKIDTQLTKSRVLWFPEQKNLLREASDVRSTKAGKLLHCSLSFGSTWSKEIKCLDSVITHLLPASEAFSCDSVPIITINLKREDI